MSLKLYSDNVPNGWKIEIMLGELDIPYAFQRIDIGKGDQFSEEFLAISPNNKVPAIIDSDGPDGQPISLFESGAILFYLADKHKSDLLPQKLRLRYQTLAWLMFQIGGIGPFLGQVYHFKHSAPEQIPYAIERYTKEADRLYGVMNKRLGNSSYLVDDSYTIADIACFPWIFSHESNHHNLDSYVNLQRWYTTIIQRPVVKKIVEKIEASNL